MPPITAYIGIGSNVGDRLAHLQKAVDMLDLFPQTAVTALSGVYMTEPVGDIRQERFFNAVIAITTELSPEALRARCKAVEHDLGRPDQYRRWSPRTIDLDILLYGELNLKSEILTIPHAELHHRKFVIIPLLDIDNPAHPEMHCTIADLLKSCADPSVPIKLTEKLLVKKKADC
ncbi:MAG: 2-amino-4-hydroxy-6-hydroxymethyldihydropteridine diphosphokinase [Chlorobiaceae bacterium]|nr:2-amino-4-hydroxy-6-hydroxymethyldihydropteridine diphosphokinase [Chlorobiaceae bacterium]